MRSQYPAGRTGFASRGGASARCCSDDSTFKLRRSIADESFKPNRCNPMFSCRPAVASSVGCQRTAPPASRRKASQDLWNSTRSGKSKRSVIRSAPSFPASIFLALGSGNRRSIKSPMRGKTSRGSRRRLRTCVPSSPSQSEEVKDKIDPGFVNDQYWLLLPFHFVWDGVAVEDTGMQKLPLGNGSAEKIVAQYSSDGGYSPGDTWELYVGADDRVQELVFRRGGSVKPGVVIATWADYKKAGPLLFSLDHRGTADDQPIRVYFSNVAVKTAGSNAWTEAQ